MQQMEKISIFCDGGAIGNPGRAASAFAVYLDSRLYDKRSISIGFATNNVAEYQAVIFALRWLIDNSKIIENFPIHFFLDSQLVVNQLGGKFKIKSQKLIKLVIIVRELEKKISNKIVYNFIPRTKNTFADSLVESIISKK